MSSSTPTPTPYSLLPCLLRLTFRVLVSLLRETHDVPSRGPNENLGGAVEGSPFGNYDLHVVQPLDDILDRVYVDLERS